MKRMPKCYIRDSDREPGFYVNIRFRITRELLIDWLIHQAVSYGKGLPRSRKKILDGVKLDLWDQNYCPTIGSFMSEEVAEEDLQERDRYRAIAVRIVKELFPELHIENYERRYGNWHYAPEVKSEED